MDVAFVIGGSGYVGAALVKRLSQHYKTFWTYFRSGSHAGNEANFLDIRNQENVRAVFTAVKPDVVFHLAYDLEDLEGSVVKGTANLLQARESIVPCSRFIFLSTDAVFDGESGPYSETDVPRPIWTYGRMKRQAEMDVLSADGMVVRNSLVYGFDPLDQRTAALKRGLETGSFQHQYFEDEIRCPVQIDDLCGAFVELSKMTGDIPAILHVTGPEAVTRYAFAAEVARGLGYGPESIPKGLLKESGIVRPRDLTMDVSLAKSILKTRIRGVSDALGLVGA